ncbi:DnaD domain protein [Clostridioides difficile]|uniref:DnaD domain protein n=1 Tax=Clostridioides difficile TaxID=1496 RepID=UPI000BB1EA64|nr:DnaD domain protein [Clostridioides difficile]PBE90905.1 DNA replication protein DnaD [Clostridioides difficile]
MFFTESNEIDLGEITIPNIFIDIFMPMADGLYVKVYLLGYRQACDITSNPKFDNNSIAKNLNIPLSDVLSAWKFWEEKKIIKIHDNGEYDNFNYSIEFLDLKNFYIENILSNNSSIKSNTDKVVSTSENPSIRKMFNSINKIVGRYLDPSEKMSIMDIMNKYNMSPDMILCAYEYVKDKTGTSKPVKYIEGIIRNWYDSNLYTPKDVEESFLVRSERYILYKTIFNELGFSRQPSKSEKELMDTWFDKFNMDIDLIINACSKSKNISNPSISYINGIIKNWNEKNIKNLNDLKQKEEERIVKENINKKQINTTQNNNTYKKTKFHNFNETFTQYTSDELDEIIKKSQKEKFK